MNGMKFDVFITTRMRKSGRDADARRWNWLKSLLDRTTDVRPALNGQCNCARYR